MREVPEVKRKKKLTTNCGNAIAEIGELKKKNLAIVAMALPKIGGGRFRNLWKS